MIARTTSQLGLVAMLCAAPLMGACSTDKQLAPQVAGDPQPNDSRAALQLGQVDVTVNTNAWEGESEVKEEYLPVFLTFHNNGSQAIQIAPSDLIMTTDGEGATPATRVEDIDEVVVTTLAVNTVGDPIPYDRVELQLPTERMTANALRFGELQAGQQLSGFAYFKDIADDAKHASLRVRTHDASGDMEATTTVPLISRAE